MRLVESKSLVRLSKIFFRTLNWVEEKLTSIILDQLHFVSTMYYLSIAVQSRFLHAAVVVVRPR